MGISSHGLQHLIYGLLAGRASRTQFLCVKSICEIYLLWRPLKQGESRKRKKGLEPYIIIYGWNPHADMTI